MGDQHYLFDADLIPTQSLNLQGATVQNPTALPVGNERIGQVLATIGSEHPSNIYEISWSGG